MGVKCTEGPLCARVPALIAAFACLMLAPVGSGQIRSNGRFDVHGEVFNRPVGGWLNVQLVDNRGGGLPMTTNVSGMGDFAFSSVPAGDYLLRLTDTYGRKLYERPVSISGPNTDLTIRLPKERVEQPVEGTVSVRELQQKVAPKALKEYKKGVAALQKGEFGKASMHFQKAIAIDPSFACAHNDLGAAYYSMKLLDKASAEFRKAAELDPDAAYMADNLALSRLALNRYPDAEAAARAALRVDPNLIQAHLILGYSLYMQKRNALESVKNLQWAANLYPQAHVVAAAILTRLARKAEAAVELQKYLRSPDTGLDHGKVKAWLTALGEPSSGRSQGTAKTPVRKESGVPAGTMTGVRSRPLD